MAEEAAGVMGACGQLVAQPSWESWAARGAPGTSVAPRGPHQCSLASQLPLGEGEGGVREGHKGEQSQCGYKT